MSENDGVKSVVVTFKCSPQFKKKIDGFSNWYDSRSKMIRDAIRALMVERSFLE